jgi:predicted DNA-binding transcriptional regulator AlpA
MFERVQRLSCRAGRGRLDPEGAMDVRATMRLEGGRWIANTSGEPELSASGRSREACLASLRRSVHRSLAEAGRAGEPLNLVVEVTPLVAGVAEVAEILGWDKRRVVTYIDRGRFPKPVQSLAATRVWLRSDIEAYAEHWRARRRWATRRS